MATRKQTFILILVVALALVLALDSAWAGTRVRISSCNAMTHPQNLGLQLFKELVEKETKGKYEIQIFPNSQLGGERESVEQVKNGVLEMATASAGPLTTFNRDVMVLDIPFSFTDYDEAWAVLDGPAGLALLKSFEAGGLKGLGYMENGFRHVTNNVRPITAVADFKGIKLRTMEAPMHMLNFKTLGASPTPVPWPELYMTLQQKVVDGQENPLMNLFEIKLWEVQKYVSLTAHIYDPMPLVANLRWFNGLPKADQDAMEKAAIYGANYSRFVNLAREKVLADMLRKKGMQVNEVSAEAKAAMRKMSQPAVAAAIQKEAKPAFVDMWINAIEKVRKDVASGL
jgi:tripartite ATP-independent transporter DctP family solute receptor